MIKNKLASKSIVVILVFVFFVVPVASVFAATTQQAPPTIINYTYDPSGQRITVSNGTTTTVYPNKNYNTDGVTVTKHIFANGTDTATIQGSGATAKVYYTHTDTLNSSSVITDSTGAVAETMDYFPFGGIRIDNKVGIFNEQRKYIGQEFDADTGFSYLNARYYNGKLGRFISEDSQFWGQQNLQDPQSLNSYSYAGNNPIVGSDPSGLLVELMSRPVFEPNGHDVGLHTFFKVTPDHPNDIHINGLATGTKEFTFGAYPSDSNWWTNTLSKQIGTTETSPDKSFAFGNGKIINKTTITPPNKQNDTEFINNMGKAYNEMNLSEVNYWGLGNIPVVFYDANSNNFAYTLGVKSGVKSQMDSFEPNPGKTTMGGAPGYGREIPTTSIYHTVRNAVYSIGSKVSQFISSLKEKNK